MTQSLRQRRKPRRITKASRKGSLGSNITKESGGLLFCGSATCVCVCVQSVGAETWPAGMYPTLATRGCALIWQTRVCLSLLWPRLCSSGFSRASSLGAIPHSPSKSLVLLGFLATVTLGKRCLGWLGKYMLIFQNVQVGPVPKYPSLTTSVG